MSERSLRSEAGAPACAVTVGHVAEVSEADVASFQTVRPRLFGIAYRVLGSASEADDVVQEAWIRWQGVDRTKVRDVAAFLATTTMRLALNVSQSAHARRETHIGLWHFDRVDAAANPWLDAERGDAVESAVHMLVEKLSSAERAAYVLREAFDYPYRHVARALGLTEANARQLVARARRRLSGEARRPVGGTEHQRLLDAFVAAARSGDLTSLEQLLAADVLASAGGDELVPATRLPVRERSGVPIAA
jgi:RNA polymerase sigma factor (sigma-70 family)